MDDEVFRANHDKVLQTFARREFLNHWNAFSVYCMEVAVAFIHCYENEHGNNLPPGLEPDELQRKSIEVNERLTVLDVQDYRDGRTLSHDFQAFFNELHGGIHARVLDRQRQVDEARDNLQAARQEVARLEQELRAANERSRQDIEREKEASRRISTSFGTETADLKARLQRLETLAGGEAAKSSEILAGFQEDRRKADEVRGRFMGELDRLKALDLSKIPELSYEILKLQDMVMGSRDFQSVIEGYAVKQRNDQRLLAAAQEEVSKLRENNTSLQRELDKLNAAPAGPSAGAGLPDGFLAVLKSYSEHCAKSNQFGDDTFQFATKKIENADFNSLDTDLRKLFGPIFEYVKGSLFTVHIMQKCVQASEGGQGVLKGYYDQIEVLQQLVTNKEIPKHFIKKHWKNFWHCVLGMGTLQNYNTFMESIKTKFGFNVEPLNPKSVFFRNPQGSYVLYSDPNCERVDPGNSAGLADRVMRVYDVKQVAMQQIILNVLSFSHTLLNFLGPRFEFSECVTKIQEELEQRVASMFRIPPVNTHQKIEQFSQIFTHVCVTPRLFLRPTFPMWLFTSGFFVVPVVNTTLCIVSKHGTNHRQTDSVEFIRELQTWFGTFIEDPDNNNDITVFEPVSNPV